MQDIEQIYTKYAVQVYKYLFSLCRDPHTAEELTQPGMRGCACTRVCISFRNLSVKSCI